MISHPQSCMYVLASLRKSKIPGWESLTTAAWVKCSPPARGRQIIWPAILNAGAILPTGDTWHYLEILLGISGLWHPGMLPSIRRCTGQLLPPRILPPQNANSAEVEEPWSQLIGPKGMQKGHPINEKLGCTEDTSNVLRQIPLNPFGLLSFSFPCPACFSQCPLGTFFKGCCLGCWGHLRAQRAGGANVYISHGWPCFGGRGWNSAL